MTENFLARNELLIGSELQSVLQKLHVVVVGLGGVGGYALEALGRLGIGVFNIIDSDVVDETNINRQIVALHSTIGTKKTFLYKKRLEDINPKVQVNVLDGFYTESLNSTIFGRKVDFVIDAIDTVRSKVRLLEYCSEHSVPVISAFGTGNRVNPSMLKICDISEIDERTGCNFSKNIIRILKSKGINSGITVVTSDEKPVKVAKIQNTDDVTLPDGEVIKVTKIVPGSISFVPAVAGFYMAYCVFDKIKSTYNCNNKIAAKKVEEGSKKLESISETGNKLG